MIKTDLYLLQKVNALIENGKDINEKVSVYHSFMGNRSIMWIPNVYNKQIVIDIVLLLMDFSMTLHKYHFSTLATECSYLADTLRKRNKMITDFIYSINNNKICEEYPEFVDTDTLVDTYLRLSSMINDEKFKQYADYMPTLLHIIFFQPKYTQYLLTDIRLKHSIRWYIECLENKKLTEKQSDTFIDIYEKTKELLKIYPTLCPYSDLSQEYDNTLLELCDVLDKICCKADTVVSIDMYKEN